MNPIKNLEIRNFKSIRHQKIDDCKRINVFVGYPNVGKSNILEAISLLGINEATRIKELVRVKEIPTIFFNGFIADDLLVSLNNEYGAIGSFSENLFSIQLQIREEGGQFHPYKLNSVLNSSVVKSLLYSDFTKLPDTQRPPIQKSYINEIAGRFNVKKYEFKNEVSSQIGNYSSLQYPFGNNIFSILQTNEQLRKDAKQLFIEYDLELLYDSREQEFTILKRTESGIFTVPYELVADTLQRLVFYKAAIYSNEKSILLFEEPEAHMFPPYVRKFTSDIIFDLTNQFFITTHSSYVLEAFMEDASKDLSIYLVYYEKGETKVKLMSEQDMDEVRKYGVDLFHNLESYLKHGQVNNA